MHTLLILKKCKASVLLQIHANICMRAVVVTETLDWRLHGLDLMTEHMATGDLPLMSASWMVGAQYKPSEIAKCEWGAIQQGPPWAVDSWGLGCLMQVSHRQTLHSFYHSKSLIVLPKEYYLRTA